MKLNINKVKQKNNVINYIKIILRGPLSTFPGSFHIKIDLNGEITVHWYLNVNKKA